MLILKKYTFIIASIIVFGSCSKNNGEKSGLNVKVLKTEEASSAEDDLATANGFTNLEYVDASHFELTGTSGTYDVTIITDTSEYLNLAIQHEAEESHVEITPDYLKLYQGSNLVGDSYEGSYLGNEMDNRVVVAILSAQYAASGNSTGRPYHGGDGGPDGEIWYCLHLGRNSGCTYQDAVMEAATYCGGYDFSLGAASTSCLWDNHGCITTRALTCN